jgi:hypothetical protein
VWRVHDAADGGEGVLDLNEEENLPANAAETGAYVRGKLETARWRARVAREACGDRGSARHGADAGVGAG